MKKYLILLPLALFALVACEHKGIYEDVSFNVTLDEGNTYYAGDVVTFDIAGNPDNLVFYSGEEGHNYAYKDRYSVEMDQVEDATLAMEFQARYGYADGLSIYVTSAFDGLNGSDADADRAAIQAMVDSGMEGWTKLDYEEGGSTAWTSQDFDLSAYLENFCIAFHYNPINDGQSAQRTYWVNGALNLKLEGISAAQNLDITSFQFVSFNMGGETDTEYVITDPYEINTHTSWSKNKTNAIVRFGQSAASIIFQGIGKGILDYPIDIWLISKPQPLSKVDNDKGTVVKNLQNKIETYEYTYEQPGTYTATFIGSNVNYKGESQDVREVTVIVMDKPDEE